VPTSMRERERRAAPEVPSATASAAQLNMSPEAKEEPAAAATQVKARMAWGAGRKNREALRDDCFLAYELIRRGRAE
jgi:hypothetical protein